MGRTEGRAKPDRRGGPIGGALFQGPLAAGNGLRKLLIRLDTRGN